MDIKPLHIIQKQCYDVTVMNEQQGMQLQKGLQDINLNYIVPALSNKLDELFGGDEVVIIEKLEINLGKIKSYTGHDEWMEMIINGLESSVRKLGLQKPERGRLQLQKISSSEHAIKVWLYFLENGMLPGDAVFKTVEELKQFVFLFQKEDRQLFRDVLLKFFSPDLLFQRMALSEKSELYFFIQLIMPTISEPEYENILLWIWNVQENKLEVKGKSFFSTSKIRKDLIVEVLKNIWMAAKANKLLYKGELQLIVDKKVKELQYNDELDKVNRKTDLPAIDKDGQIDKIINVDDDKIVLEGIFVSNAGLCILAPYFGLFFKSLGLCNDVNFLSKSQQQHAIYLVHHLATGDVTASEEQLVFAKILCGWPLQMPCVLEGEITNKEISESNELLVSVISHWQTLKSTSPNGLREGFLQRGGKLFIRDEVYILQVEQHSIDVLLERIPWTFRMLKLPWMKKMINVEWF